MKRVLFIAIGLLMSIAPQLVFAADQYSWHATYTVVDPSTSGSSGADLTGGPFSTQQACYQDQGNVNSKYPGKTVDLTQTLCTCDKTVAAQGSGCPGYTAPDNSQNGNGSSNEGNSSPNTPQFVSLSNIPALGLNQTSIPSLPIFLNDLYKICIGIAVVIAVLQLIRGGITYMLVDSVTTKEQARHSITAAILGLILVLSPYIVFSVINPHILDLDISQDVGKLQPGANSSTSNTNSSQTNGQALTSNLKQGDSLIQCASDTCDAAEAQCSNIPGGGSPDHVCKNLQTGAITDTSALSGYACDQGSYNYIQCTPLVKQSQACTGATKETCPAVQCPSGTTQNYECVNATTGAQVSGNTGNLSCATGYTLTVQCR